MKRKIYIIVTIVLIAMLSLTACGTTSANKTDNVAAEFADLTAIPGYEYLYYSKETKSVYYLFSTSEDFVGGFSYGYGYFGPYIRNGHFCEYVDGQIVEIINDTNN